MTRDEQLAVYYDLIGPARDAFHSRTPDLRQLVHYSTLGALEGMLATKKLWLSPIKVMNDFREIDAGKELIRHAEDDTPITRAISVLENHAPELWPTLHSQFYERLEIDRDHTFISCWSECDAERFTHDDLTMWRAYGGDGEGVAIVVDASSMLPPFGMPQEVVPCPVFYETPQAFNARAATYLQSFTLAYLCMSEERRHECLWYAAHAFADLCFYLAVSHKNPGFASEKEWRFVWRRTPKAAAPLDGHVMTHQKFERLCMPLDGSMESNSFNLTDIMCVMIGPCRDQDAIKSGVRNQLQRAGLNPDDLIQRSEIPYRSRK